MAAEKITIANPAWAQMKMTISRNVLKPGALSGGSRTAEATLEQPQPLAVAAHAVGQPGMLPVTALSRPLSNGGPA